MFWTVTNLPLNTHSFLALKNTPSIYQRTQLQKKSCQKQPIFVHKIIIKTGIKLSHVKAHQEIEIAGKSENASDWKALSISSKLMMQYL